MVAQECRVPVATEFLEGFVGFNLCRLEKQFGYDDVQQSSPILLKSETEFKEVNSVGFNPGFYDRAT